MRVVQSLKTKIVACVICLMIVCFIIFSIVGNQITKKNVSEAMLDKCVAETEQIADQVELLLNSGADTEALQKLVESQVANHTEIAYAVVIDSTVTAVAHSDTEKIGKVYDDD